MAVRRRGGVRRSVRRRATDSRPLETAHERGFSIVEVLVAMTVTLGLMIGLAGVIGSSLKVVALVRQRQTASEIASARLEHLRDIPYASLALQQQPVHSTDTTNPEYWVSTDGATYDVTGEGTNEPLIVDAAAGGVLHVEDPVTIGRTVVEIYQYVTWYDNPRISGAQNLKRVSVIVRYKNTAVGGASRILRQSALFSPTGEVFSVATSSTTSSGTTTSTTSTSTTTAANPCGGDVTAPTGSFTLAAASGATIGYAPTVNVTATLAITDDCSPLSATVNFSNDGVNYASDQQLDPLDPTLSWTLSTGDGTKTVYVRVRDAAGNTRSLTSQQVVLDTTKPTVPGTLTRTVSCQGQNRTVVLHWSASSDANFVGYRVYRSTDGVNWSALTSTTSLTSTDTNQKSLTSVRYYVVGYDKAGNESNATNTISLTKNQCS